MGCNGGKFLEIQKSIIINSIIDSIERNDCSRVKEYLELYANLDKSTLIEIKDKEIIQYREMHFNILSFCLWIGRSVSFLYCLDRLHCSFESMQASFQNKHIIPINYICEQGLIEPFKVYLPYYIAYLESLNTSQRSFSARLDKQKDNYAISSNAAQLACYSEHIAILCYMNDYFLSSTPPKELDLHYIDESTGENCALIACRSGNLALLKVLHEKIRANFHILNNKNEGALQVMAEATKFQTEKVFLPSFMYLIEVVKVELNEHYYQISENLADIEILHYLESVHKKFSWSQNEGESLFQNKISKNESSIFKLEEDISEIIKASYEGSILI